MLISKKGEYALRALVCMMAEPRWWMVHEISGRANIPQKFLEQVLLALRKAEILVSKRGVNGGYLLQRQPSSVDVLGILEAVDGPFRFASCGGVSGEVSCTCPDTTACPVRGLSGRLNEEIRAALAAKTLEDLARSGGRTNLAFDI
jgi:Rrf2 family protein